MKFGLLLVGALLLGVSGAHYLIEDRGYVLINFRGTSIETSVPVLIVVLALFYAAIRIAIRMLRAPKELGEAAGRYRSRRSRQRLTQGLIDISEGHLARAERMLTQGARSSDNPLLNYLTAARAAQLQGATKRRDNWLKLAYEKTPEAATAVLLTQAELQIAHEQYDEAQATLKRLQESDPNHDQSLALLAKLYRQLEDWPKLRELLPRLSQRKVLSQGKIAALSIDVYRESLRDAGDARKLEDVRAIWQALPKRLRTAPELSAPYFSALAACGEVAFAEQQIRKTLKSNWNGELVSLYGKLKTGDPEQQLRYIEKWLKTRGEDAELLLSAARLSMQGELWGKARSYLEASIGIRPTAASYQLLGRLLEQLGEGTNASDAFRSGLALTTGTTVDELPALQAPQATADDADTE